MKDLISIIVPIYNVEKYLNKCIESIVNQTYENIEIILIDDGSNDNSGIICDEYAKKDNRIIVVHKENGGVSSARNKGLKIAKGTLNGVKDGAAVLYGKYLIGVIKKAYPTYSVVNTILDPDFSVSAYDISTNELSFVSGDASLAKQGVCKFENLSSSSKISPAVSATLTACPLECSVYPKIPKTLFPCSIYAFTSGIFLIDL